MSDPNDVFAGPNPNRRKLILGLLLVVVVGFAAFVLFGSRTSLLETDVLDSGDRLEQATHEIYLYFGDADGISLQDEDREVPSASTFENDVEIAIRELISGPKEEGHVGAMPRGTRLSQAFFDEQFATLYLDFNSSLLTQHPGGSTAEFFTLSALLRTIGANFVVVRDVQILVDGNPINSLAGHFDTSKPLEIATWR